MCVRVCACVCVYMKNTETSSDPYVCVCLFSRHRLGEVFEQEELSDKSHEVAHVVVVTRQVCAVYEHANRGQLQDCERLLHIHGARRFNDDHARYDARACVCIKVCSTCYVTFISILKCEITYFIK